MILYVLHVRLIIKYELLLEFSISSYIHTVIGVFIFRNQHTYNPAYVVKTTEWNFTDSGLVGSSLIKIPFFLKYFTGGIEYHHIHHLNSKIPGYNLHKYHHDVKTTSYIFDNVKVLNITDCINNLSLNIYDEKRNLYITFDEADYILKNQ